MSIEKINLALAVALFMPLLGAATWFWLQKWIGEKATGLGAAGFIFLSFVCALWMFFQVDGAASVEAWRWISTGSSSPISFSFLLDPLSLSLGLVVTGVGSLIHLYASAYMHGDPGYGRFFSYLNLFVFSMLMLIWSQNLLGIFLGWEGVGLCSYLLISFWFNDLANAEAGKKAFIVNRIGDFGFLVAMFCLFKAFGSLDVVELLDLIRAGGLSADQMNYTWWACLGLILGATGKSAQIPLYVWLPDAMAGPTPVSALIHAATMVTAGIYLACRLQGLFLLHPETLQVIAYVGGATAALAACIAVFQDDIKKVLAYSTISQLGLMFLAVGLVAPVAAYFHLITHAFFKALLFLGAGSVIHGLHHEQDMKKMGGLRKQMPVTFWTMTIGVLAIAGMPPLSGFFSKDEIVHALSGSGRPVLIFLGCATVFLTAFYMGRLWFLSFFGSFRGEKPAHESPWPMTSVLISLAVAAVFAGVLNWPEVWGGGAILHHYLGAIVKQADFSSGPEAFAHSIEIAALSVGLGLSGLGLAFWKYRKFSGEDFSAPIFSAARNKFYVDEIYSFVVVRNIQRMGEFFWRIVDVRIIDGILNGTARVVMKLAEQMRRLQNGYLQSYSMWVLLGVLVLVIGAFSIR